jgi:NTE family protein
MARVAIACQGGGSPTAFTAGVLQHLLAHMITGSSRCRAPRAGPCAPLAWYGLRRSWRAKAVRLLEGFGE